jgi:hypothetical protein
VARLKTSDPLYPKLPNPTKLFAAASSNVMEGRQFVTRHAVSLLFLCAGLAFGGSFPDATVALVAHFETSSGPRILVRIAAETAAFFRPAGLSLEWYPSREAAPANAARTLDVWFHGDCWPPDWQSSGMPPGSTRLGWVRSEHGRIVREISVDCSLVMRFAAAARHSSTSSTLLDLVYTRFMERVVGHELLHVLLMSPQHGRSDFTRPRLYASDWRRIGSLTRAEVQSLRQRYGLSPGTAREAAFLSFLSDAQPDAIGKLLGISIASGR